MTFDRYLDSSATEAPAEYQNDEVIVKQYLVASRRNDILR